VASSGKDSVDGLFVSRLRRPTLTHAFERALEDARFEWPAAIADGQAEGAQPEDPAQKFHSALDAVTGLARSRRYVAPRSLAAAYKAEAEQADRPKAARAARPERAQPPKRPQPIKLRPGLGARDLMRLRRQYALDNHPDRMPPEMREQAAKLMAEANAAIDKALKQAGGS